ncbi:hypothetical protein STANM309S_04185 [Streptomyces tanashiensis]
MTVETPNTAPIAPWYLPRSRSGIDIGDERHRGDHQTAGADALETAPDDQQRHVGGESAEERSR